MAWDHCGVWWWGIMPLTQNLVARISAIAIIRLTRQPHNPAPESFEENHR